MNPASTGLMAELGRLPAEIKTASLGLLALGESHASLERSIALLEMETAMLVASAKSEGGGKAAYPNDLARKAEVSRRLSQDERAINLRDAERSARSSIERAKVELAFLEGRFSAARHLIDFLAATKGGED